MAEGPFRHLGKGTYDAYSAGVSPSTVNPLAIRAMNEIGLDISHHTSNNANDYTGQEFDLVITVCDNAKESCPIFPGANDMQHWPFDDPANAEGTEEERMAVFRQVRDEIRDEIEDFLKKKEETP